MGWTAVLVFEPRGDEELFSGILRSIGPVVYIQVPTMGDRVREPVYPAVVI